MVKKKKKMISLHGQGKVSGIPSTQRVLLSSDPVRSPHPARTLSITVPLAFMVSHGHPMATEGIWPWILTAGCLSSSPNGPHTISKSSCLLVPEHLYPDSGPSERREGRTDGTQPGSPDRRQQCGLLVSHIPLSQVLAR